MTLVILFLILVPKVHVHWTGLFTGDCCNLSWKTDRRCISSKVIDLKCTESVWNSKLKEIVGCLDYGQFLNCERPKEILVSIGETLTNTTGLMTSKILDLVPAVDESDDEEEELIGGRYVRCPGKDCEDGPIAGGLRGEEEKDIGEDVDRHGEEIEGNTRVYREDESDREIGESGVCPRPPIHSVDSLGRTEEQSITITRNYLKDTRMVGTRDRGTRGSQGATDYGGNDGTGMGMGESKSTHDERDSGTAIGIDECQEGNTQSEILVTYSIRSCNHVVEELKRRMNALLQEMRLQYEEEEERISEEQTEDRPEIQAPQYEGHASRDPQTGARIVGLQEIHKATKPSEDDLKNMANSQHVWRVNYYRTWPLLMLYRGNSRPIFTIPLEREINPDGSQCIEGCTCVKWHKKPEEKGKMACKIGDTPSGKRIWIIDEHGNIHHSFPILNSCSLDICGCSKVCAESQKHCPCIAYKMRSLPCIDPDENKMEAEITWGILHSKLYEKDLIDDCTSRVCCKMALDEMLTPRNQEEQERHPDRWQHLCCRWIRRADAEPNSAPLSPSNSDDEFMEELTEFNRRQDEFLQAVKLKKLSSSVEPIVEGAANMDISEDATDGRPKKKPSYKRLTNVFEQMPKTPDKMPRRSRRLMEKETASYYKNMRRLYHECDKEMAAKNIKARSRMAKEAKEKQKTAEEHAEMN